MAMLGGMDSLVATRPGGRPAIWLGVAQAREQNLVVVHAAFLVTDSVDTLAQLSKRIPHETTEESERIPAYSAVPGSTGVVAPCSESSGAWYHDSFSCSCTTSPTMINVGGLGCLHLARAGSSASVLVNTRC